MYTRTKIALMLASLSMLGAAIANAAPPVPAKAKDATDGMTHVATCNDGKEYYARTNEHRGACSGHMGVLSWTDGTPVKSHGGKKTSYR